MTTALGCDYSWQVPTAEQIKAVGYTFAMRYLSWEFGKNLKPLELLALHARGISVGLVWESTADRPVYGAAAGAADGAEAGRQANALGVPKSVPLFWALDEDDRTPGVSYANLKAYGDAFARASGHFSFPYGSYRVIEFFQAGWQTEAWSGGLVSPHAYLYQRAGGSRIAGCDENVLFNAYALWAPTSKPVVIPKPPVVKPPKPAKPYKPTQTGYPNITGADHAHPTALAELKRKIKLVNSAADVSTDAATLKTVEEFKAFFKIKGDPKGGVGQPLWQALDYLTALEK